MLLYLSNNELYHLANQTLNPIPCQAVDQYRKTLQEIKQRKEWKTTGSGAQFMGLARYRDADEGMHVYPCAVVMTEQDQIIYAARLDSGTAIYAKSLIHQQEAEGLILRKSDFIVHDMSYEPTLKRLVLSSSMPGQYEKHLTILPVEGNRIQFVTEGECQDANPSFDPVYPEQIYYDSRGLAYDQQGRADVGPRKICLLNLQQGEIATLVEHADFDFLMPIKDGLGNLYFLKRPYKNKHNPFSVLKDIILSPFKIFKAIIGWLDFFTQRYTGESLKTSSGTNPAKARPKSPEEMFIEGNLINAEKTLQQNINTGEKFPGFIPASWQLVKQTPSGDLVIVKKGVLSYTLQDGNVIYSNGKYLVQLDPHQTETMLSEAKLIHKIAS